MSGTLPGSTGDACFASADVVVRAQAGDVAARESLFAHYRPLLDRFLSARLPRSSRALLDTRDAVQEILLRAISTLARFEYRGAGSFWAHLRTIAARFLVDQYRRGERQPAADAIPDTGLADGSMDGARPDAEAIRREELERFDRALVGLDPRSHEAVLARLEGGWEYAEIARHCGFTSADAARMAVARAVARLGKLMAEDSR